MKRSRATQDLVALETQKRNKTVDPDGWTAALMTRTASAEEELSRLLEAHAVQQQHRFHSMDFSPLDDMTDCLRMRSHHRSDTRAASLSEREARDAQQALTSKRLSKLDTETDELFPNSPDTIDHIFSDCFLMPRRRRSAEAPAFDMSSFRQVLEPHAAA